MRANELVVELCSCSPSNQTASGEFFVGSMQSDGRSTSLDRQEGIDVWLNWMAAQSESKRWLDRTGSEQRSLFIHPALSFRPSVRPSV